MKLFQMYLKTLYLNRYITCDDKDPVWMSENVKPKITAQNLKGVC